MLRKATDSHHRYQQEVMCNFCNHFNCKSRTKRGWTSPKGQLLKPTLQMVYAWFRYKLTKTVGLKNC